MSNVEQIQKDYTEWAAQNNVIVDEGIDGNGTQESLDNASIVVNYFNGQLKKPLTLANLNAVTSVLLPHLKQYESAAHREYASLPSHDRARFAEWLPNSGLEDTFTNANAILGWLKGRGLAATKEHFVLAQGQSRVQHFLTFKYQPRPVDGRSHSNNDDGKKFGGDMVSDGRGGWRNKNYNEQKKDREAAAAVAQAPQTQKPADAWTRLVNDQLRHGPHSMQEASKTEYDKALAKGLSMREIYVVLDNLHRSRSNPVDRARY